MSSLSVNNLSVSYDQTRVVHALNFAVSPGETVALLGPSGVGKTTVMRALLGLLPPSARAQGKITLGDTTIDLTDRKALRRNLGQRIGFVAQDPFDACAPTRRVRDHLAEGWRAHGLPDDEARMQQLLQALGLGAEALNRYPHEFSGGMLQRINIAAALALNPDVVFADEPTAALDRSNGEAALALLRSQGRALVIITHDLDLAARHADRIILLEDGRMAATCAGSEAFSPDAPPPVRAFAKACTLPERPTGELGPELLRVSNMGLARGGRTVLHDVGFCLRRGEILAVTGASGSGKSSLLSALTGRLPIDSGQISWAAGRPPRMAGIFQDATGSLNPRWPLLRIVGEPLVPRRILPGLPEPHRARVHSALQAVGLGAVDARSRPHSLSAGMCQRVAIARSNLAAADLILADEPTSALDPVQKARILQLLVELAQAGAAVLLITHDLGIARIVAHQTLDLRLSGASSFHPEPEAGVLS